MLFIFVIFLTVILLKIFKKPLVNTFLVILPLSLALIFSFFSLDYSNLFAEVEFYVLFGFLISQISSYKENIWHKVFAQLGLTDEKLCIATIGAENKALKIYPFRVPFVVVNIKMVLLYFYFITFIFTNTSFVLGSLSLLLLLVISGTQTSLLPFIFICFFVITVCYAVEVLLFENKQMQSFLLDISRSKGNN